MNLINGGKFSKYSLSSNTQHNFFCFLVKYYWRIYVTNVTKIIDICMLGIKKMVTTKI